METMETTEDIKETANSNRTELEKREEERMQLVAQVVSRRQRYPKQCAEYLSKTMELKLNALKKSSVEMSDPGPYSVNQRTYPKEVYPMADDRGDLRVQIQRKSREINDLTRSFQELESIVRMISDRQNVLTYEKLNTSGDDLFK